MTRKKIKPVTGWAVVKDGEIFEQLNHNATFNLMISSVKKEAMENSLKELGKNYAKIIKVKITPL